MDRVTIILFIDYLFYYLTLFLMTMLDLPLITWMGSWSISVKTDVYFLDINLLSLDLGPAWLDDKR